MRKYCGLLFFFSILVIQPRDVLAHAAYAKKAHLGALAVGKIFQSFAHMQRSNNRHESAALAQAGVGLSYIAQAGSLYKLHKQHGSVHTTPDELEERVERPFRSRLLAINIIKAAFGAYYHSVGGKSNRSRSYFQHAVWNGLLASLSVFAKFFRAYISRGGNVEFYVTRDSSMELSHDSSIGQGLEALVCLFEYAEVYSYLSACNEFRALNTPHLRKITPLKTPAAKSMCCVGCGNSQPECSNSGETKPVHVYCHSSQGNCGYHEACLQKMLADGQSICPVCENVFRYEVGSDVYSYGVKLLQFILLPLYFAL